MRKTRTTPTVPVTTTAETMATTTPTARALVERVGDEAGEDSQPVQMRRIAALMAECEDACTSEAIAEARRVHLEKLTKVKDAVIKVVPRTDATTKHHARRRSTEGQVDDAWIRANSERKRGLLLSNASDDAPQDDIGRGSSERACCGNRRLQRGLLPVTSEPRWNGESSLDRTASRGRAGTRVHLGSRVSFPALKGAPRAWDSYSAGVLTNSMQMKQSQYDGCLFYRFEQERIEEKAGRHIDDFLVTGPEPNVERFVEQARDKLNMQDAVRLYKTGDEGRLLAIIYESWTTGIRCKENLFSFTELPQHSEWRMQKQVPYQKPSTRRHKNNHSHQAKHETSGHALVKQCTSVIIVQTFSTA